VYGEDLEIGSRTEEIYGCGEKLIPQQSESERSKRNVG